MLIFSLSIIIFLLNLCKPPLTHTNTHAYVHCKALNTQFVSFSISPSIINKYKTKRPPTEQERERTAECALFVCVCERACKIMRAFWKVQQKQQKCAKNVNRHISLTSFPHGHAIILTLSLCHSLVPLFLLLPSNNKGSCCRKCDSCLRVTLRMT